MLALLTIKPLVWEAIEGSCVAGLGWCTMDADIGMFTHVPGDGAPTKCTMHDDFEVCTTRNVSVLFLNQFVALTAPKTAAFNFCLLICSLPFLPPALYLPMSISKRSACLAEFCSSLEIIAMNSSSHAELCCAAYDVPMFNIVGEH